MPDTIPLALTVTGGDADDDRRHELAGFLLGELRSARVGDARRAGGGPAAPGTRGVDLQTVGALLVVLQNSAALVTDVASVVSLVRGWLGRSTDPARTVDMRYGKLHLKLGNATAAQQDQAVAAFLAALAHELDPEER